MRLNLFEWKTNGILIVHRVSTVILQQVFCLYSVKTSKISSVNLYITLLVTKTYITPASHYISFDVKTLNMKTINNLPFVFHSNKRKSYSSSSLSIDSSNDSSSSVFHLHTNPMIIRFRSIYLAN